MVRATERDKGRSSSRVTLFTADEGTLGAGDLVMSSIFDCLRPQQLPPEKQMAVAVSPEEHGGVVASSGNAAIPERRMPRSTSVGFVDLSGQEERDHPPASIQKNDLPEQQPLNQKQTPKRLLARAAGGTRQHFPTARSNQTSDLTQSKGLKNILRVAPSDKASLKTGERPFSLVEKQFEEASAGFLDQVSHLKRNPSAQETTEHLREELLQATAEKARIEAEMKHQLIGIRRSKEVMEMALQQELDQLELAKKQRQIQLQGELLKIRDSLREIEEKARWEILTATAERERVTQESVAGSQYNSSAVANRGQGDSAPSGNSNAGLDGAIDATGTRGTGEIDRTLSRPISRAAAPSVHSVAKESGKPLDKMISHLEEDLEVFKVDNAHLSDEINALKQKLEREKVKASNLDQMAVHAVTKKGGKPLDNMMTRLEEDLTVFKADNVHLSDEISILKQKLEQEKAKASNLERVGDKLLRSERDRDILVTLIKKISSKAEDDSTETPLPTESRSSWTKLQTDVIAPGSIKSIVSDEALENVDVGLRAFNVDKALLSTKVDVLRKRLEEAEAEASSFERVEDMVKGLDKEALSILREKLTQKENVDLTETRQGYDDRSYSSMKPSIGTKQFAPKPEPDSVSVVAERIRRKEEEWRKRTTQILKRDNETRDVSPSIRDGAFDPPGVTYIRWPSRVASKEQRE